MLDLNLVSLLASWPRTQADCPWRLPSSGPTWNFLLVGHSAVWFILALLIDLGGSADAHSVRRLCLFPPFAIDIYFFHSHIRVTGHRLEEWGYLKLRWCVDRPSNKDIKHLWLENGDLPAINKQCFFLGLPRLWRWNTSFPFPCIWAKTKASRK